MFGFSPAVGAVYDRAQCINTRSRAVIDRAYSRELSGLRVFETETNTEHLQPLPSYSSSVA